MTKIISVRAKVWNWTETTLPPTGNVFPSSSVIPHGNQRQSHQSGA